MGLFFHEFEHEYTKRGTSNWENLGRAIKQAMVTGVFFERDNMGQSKSIQISSNEEFIFYYENENLKCLQLNLTVLEDNFSYNQNKRVYEIKLKRKNLLTIISTFDYEIFVSFYKHLAKFTILNCFEKHYKILNLIGSGSYSKVYNGQNAISKETVALKVFQKSFISTIKDGQFVINNEILNLEKLRQFKLSPLIGVYETNDCVIIVMHKAEAGNMLDYLQLHAQDYNEQLIKIIIFKVLQSLKQLHSAGFIHKDIKPENILFNNYSLQTSIFLGDFGCSVMKNDLDSCAAGKMCSGTLGFIAPEILKSEIYDQKCDIFSLGSLFYFLLNGQSLFSNKSGKQIYDMVFDDKTIQRKINCLLNLTTSSKDLIKNLLKVNPQQRLSASQAMKHDFFKDMQPQNQQAGQQNYSLTQYIYERVKKFFK